MQACGGSSEGLSGGNYPGSTPCKLAGRVANPSHPPVAVGLQRPPHSPRCQACILPCPPGGSLRTHGLLSRRGQLSWGCRACCSCLLSNGTPRPVTMATASTRQSPMGMGTDSLPFLRTFPSGALATRQSAATAQPQGICLPDSDSCLSPTLQGTTLRALGTLFGEGWRKQP